MSWSDDTRCLYCDGKLPLYRKLTNGQFCSTGHQKAYWKEQERLAVEVLHRTHDALMAFRPAQDIELIIGPAVGWNGGEEAPAETPAVQEPPRVEHTQPHYEHPPQHEQPHYEQREEPVYEAARPNYESSVVEAPSALEPVGPPFANFIAGSAEGLTPSWTVLPVMRSTEPVHEEPKFSDLLIRTVGERETPSLAMQLRTVETPVRVPVQASEVTWTSSNVIPIGLRPPAPLLLASELQPAVEPTLAAPQRQVFVEPVATEPAALEETIEPVVMMEPVMIANRVVIIEPGLLEKLSVSIPEPAFLQWEPPAEREEPVAVAAAPVEPAPVEEKWEKPVQVEDHGPVPPFAGWQHRQATFASAWSATAALAQNESPEPAFFFTALVQPVLSATEVRAFPGGLEAPQELSLEAAEIAPLPRAATLTWFRLGAFNPPQLVSLSLAVDEPHVRLAGGCRYAMAGVVQTVPPSAFQAVTFTADKKAIAYPLLTPRDWLTAVKADLIPDPAQMIGLSAWKTEIGAHAMPHDSAIDPNAQMVAFAEPVWLPALRLLPLRWTPSQPVAPAPVEAVVKPAPLLETPTPQPKDHPHLGSLLLGFWKNAPRDLRLLVFAIPALLALAFHPSLPKVHVSTVQATEPVEKNVNQAVNGSWNSFKQVVSERAAIQLDEDFRQGLDDWSSPGGTATEWSFDANGFVRPGSLALYSPSLSLADYEVQFLGIIDQKALSWVVRAEDFSNYYVIKLVVLKPGPLTTLGLTRYAVINGKPQDRVDAVVPFTARPDMIYRVRMDVHDDSFLLAIQGQIVDAWSESKLKKGGIGFYSARGEGSRVRWLQVTHQYDMLGRLCSYLAPYDLSAAGFMPTETTKSNSKDNGSWQR